MLGEGRALDMALQAGDILIARCIDGDGGVLYVCGGEGAGIAGLLEDQAAALALWALSERSGALSLASSLDVHDEGQRGGEESATEFSEACD